MSDGCLSNVLWSVIKSSLPTVTGKTTWCPASYKRTISLFPSLHKQCFCCGHFKLSQSLQGGKGYCRRSEFCVHCFISAFPSSFLLYFIHSSMILSVLALPEVTCSVPGCLCLGLSPSRLHFRAVPPEPCYPQPCQVCLIASPKSKLLERVDDKYFESAVSLESPFPHE